ncbi:26.5 kDa heat shock protein, mitochondrial [Carica papaya]|uniref:26.5 kDa heat shock protein, mitochondrial n=1 Tax=Carica papaya TaxID=3649 RepID=UPI000B8CD67A|nr:26.5 kDa heat shock protein, mitochondrial [Carica papaya]
MALARLVLRNLLQKRVSPPPFSFLLGQNGERGLSGVQGVDKVLRRSMVTAADHHDKEDDKNTAVTERKSSSMSPRRRNRRGLWRRNDSDFVPALYEFFPSGLGNALLQATENINRLFENMNLSPSQLMGRIKEQDDRYILRYDMPGLTKEDVKITIDDGVLSIKGEHKEEEGSNEEHWSSTSYGYYDTKLSLPDDAKADEIKAELKDGVLTVMVPRTEKPKKHVKEVMVH